MKALLGLFALLVCLAQSQGFTPDGLPISPLVTDSTERVSPCGVRVFAFDPRSSSSQYLLEVKFTSRTGVKFETQLLPSAPGAQDSLLIDQCVTATHKCTTSTNGQSCVISEGCGSATTWYIVVRTRDLVEGFFSLSATVASLPPGEPLTINADDEVDEWREVSGVGKTFDNTLNKYDFFQFSTDNTDPVGTTLHIEIVTLDPVRSVVETYLNYGSTLAFPAFACHSFVKDTFLIPACEYSQGGQWHFTVIRTVLDQKYKIRVWKEVPIIIDLAHEDKIFYQLKRANDEVYFKFDGLSEYDESAALRFFAIVDNVHGGSLALGLQYGGLPWLECNSNTKSCSTAEGCHIALSPCDLDDKLEDSWYLGVRALSVNLQKEELGFTVSALIREIATTEVHHSDPIVGRLLQGQQSHYKMGIPTEPSGNWVNFFIYVDRRVTDLPASLYISPHPFPGENVQGCANNTKACSASQTVGNTKSCFIQLDPCELAAYPDGIYLSVIASSPNSGLQSHFWYQDTMGYTIHTKVWNPSEDPQALTVGQVITEVVSDAQYNIFRLIDFTGILRLTVSGNLHNIINPTPAQKARQEVAVSLLYGDRVEGPSCGTCWNIEQTKIVHATETLDWVVQTCSSGSEGVFVVVRGLANVEINTTDVSLNHFVLSTTVILDGFAGDNTREISEGQHSSTFTQTPVAAIGGTEYWILRFDRRDLTHKALDLQLRAHPRSGRTMQISTFSGDFDYACGQSLPAISSCAVNDLNRGFCTISYHACFFESDRDSRTFLVVVSADTSVHPIGGNSSTDRLYDFSFDVVEQDPIWFELDAPIATSVRQTIYTHLAFRVPDTAVETQTLIIEAYFEGVAQARNLAVYGNHPSRGDNTLAGNPIHGCYCNSFNGNDVEKVVLIIDRCSVEGGVYHLGLYGTGLVYEEGPTKVTVHAYLVDFVQPLAYEFPMDTRLFLGQTSVFQIEIDERMVNSLNRTDKELTIFTKINSARLHATIQWTFHSVLADCFCATLGDKGYACAPRTNDQCRLQRDYCQLRPPGHYYVVATVRPLPGFDKRQSVPFTIMATKENEHPIIQTLQVVSGCGFQNRAGAEIDTFVQSEELQFFVLADGDAADGLQSGGRRLEIYINNVTDGDVSVQIGNSFLPTTYCSAAQKACLAAPTGPTCVAQAVCSAKATHVSVKATSTNSNEPVKFKISACVADLNELTFGTQASKALEPGSSNVFEFDLAGNLDTSRTPAVVIKVSAANFAAGERFTISITRGACGACKEFGRTWVCQTQNCSAVLFYCDLPLDYANTKWTLQIDNGRSVNTVYNYLVFAVPVKDPELLTNVGNTGITTSIPSLDWGVYRYTLTDSQVFPPQRGIQSSSVTLRSLDGFGARVESFKRAGDLNFDGVEDRCLRRIAATHVQNTNVAYLISDCCTEAGTYDIFLFNHDFSNTAQFLITPSLTNIASNTGVEWSFVSDRAVSGSIRVEPSASGVAGAFTEAYTLYPGSPQEAYGSLVVQVWHQDRTAANAAGVRAFVKEGSPAGDRACLANDARLTFVEGQAIYQRFACNRISPHDLWVGVQNANTVAQNFNVTFANVAPVRLVLGSFSGDVRGWFGVNQQFYVDLPRISTNLNFEISVETLTGVPVQAFYALDHPAGLRTRDSCTRTAASDPNGIPVAGNTLFTRNISSCSFTAAGRLYVGVQPGAYTESRFRVRVAEVNNLAGSDKTPFTWNVALRNQVLSNKWYQGTIPTGAAREFTVGRISVSNFSASANAVTYAIDVFRDGQCSDSTHSFCTTARGVPKCSTVIPSCELRDGATYYFRVRQLTGAASVQFTILPELVDLQPTNLTLSERRNHTYSHSIAAHELHQFIFYLPPGSLLPGEHIRFSLNAVDCGAVEITGNRGERSGPRCGATLTCNVTGCTIVELAQCDLFQKGDNHRTDFWIFVRGRDQTMDSTIQYTLSITRWSGWTMKTMYTNEEHHVLALPTPVSKTINCAVGLAPNFPKPCCSLAGDAAQYTWAAEPTVFVYAIEGAEILGIGHQFRLTVDQKTASAGKLSIWNQMPHFCTTGPRLAYSSGFFKSCIANSTNDRTCVITLTNGNGTSLCPLIESHQLFVAIETVSLLGTTSLPVSDPTPFPVATLRHNHVPHDIIAVNYSYYPQYFRFTLSFGESLYVKAFHAENRSTWDAYHFRATVLDVNGGTVTMYDFWTCGANKICSDTQCQYPKDGVCVNDYPPCTCSVNEIDCVSGDMNHLGESVFRLTVTNVLADNALVIGRIKFEFVEDLIPLENQTCAEVACRQANYYDEANDDIPITSLYRFQLSGVAGATTMTINDDLIPPLFNNGRDAPCSYRRRCGVSGSLDSCEIIYRGEGVPYAAINPSIGTPCDDNTAKRYHLRADLYNPYIRTIENGVLYTSTFDDWDPRTNCTISRSSEYYMFTATEGSYLWVEITTPGPTTQVWMTPDHISHWVLGDPIEPEGAIYGCKTTSSCYFVHACAYSSGVYFFQVSPGNHTIRVVSKDFLVVNLAVGQLANTTLPTDPTQLVAFHITGDGQNLNPKNDMEVYYSTGVNVDAWLTRSSFGDVRCSYAHKNNDPDDVLTVRECDFAFQGDVWIIHFARRPATTCIGTPITVRAQWAVNNLAPILPAVSHLITPGQVISIKHETAPLGDDDVVYTRITTNQPAILNLKLRKGNHLKPSLIDYAPPCRGPKCSTGDRGDADYNQITWQDNCWHCGNGTYNAIFVEVEVEEADPHKPQVEFVDVFQVLKWTELNSQEWVNETFTGPDRRMAFYTAWMPRTEATRIDLEVNDGPGVEVSIYFADCAVRAATKPVVMWCFAGHRCTLPLHRMYNFGTFWTTTDVSSPFTDTQMRIVVTGFASSYSIGYNRGVDTCSELTDDNAPFCSNIGLRNTLMSGDSLTFWNKDLKAQQQFANLTTAFSCPQEDGCGCSSLPDRCIEELRQFACMVNFGPCSDAGFKTDPLYKDCNTVEHYCEKSFIAAGLPYFSCTHNYYSEGVGFEDEDGEPIFPIDESIEDVNDGGLAGGWIALIVILCLLAVLLIAAVAYVLIKRESRVSYSQLTQEDFDAKGYSLM